MVHCDGQPGAKPSPSIGENLSRVVRCSYEYGEAKASDDYSDYDTASDIREEGMHRQETP